MCCKGSHVIEGENVYYMANIYALLIIQGTLTS